MKKRLFFIAAVLFAVVSLSACGKDPVAIKVLILPKFEIGEMSGDDAGEAQYYYETYCMGGEEYEISGGFENNKLYVKDGVALYVTGMGKVNTAVSLAAVLNDSRFDFFDAYILSTGCAGSAAEYGTMGDVYLITSAVDFDLGYTADVREMADGDDATTWFHEPDYDSAAIKRFDPELMDKVYALIKDVQLETTENTLAIMDATFDGADWAMRDPQVLCGTAVTSDSFWKGRYDHYNALLVAETYDCPDPFAATKMEDIAVAVTADRYGMLDRCIVLRDAVNPDCFLAGETPESLWDPDYPEYVPSGSDLASLDIFPVARRNNFAVGSVVVDAILQGLLK